MPQKLSGRQLAIMQVLWSNGPATVADVQDALQTDHKLAYSTVATLLSRMERKGVVKHREDGRTFVYEPLVSEDRISTSLVSDLVRRAFDGSPSQLVSYLLETEHVDHDELTRIKQLVADHEAAEQNHGNSEGPTT